MVDFRPSLAAEANWDDFRRIFDEGDMMLASPKLDGIRCIIRNGQAVSRSLKPIANHFIRNILSDPRYEGMDGEITVGPPFGQDVMQRTSSGVMSREGTPQFTYWVFDNHIDGETGLPFMDRYQRLLEEQDKWPQPDSRPGGNRVLVLSHLYVADLRKLEELESTWVEHGYEGVICRHVGAPYKQGRSTLRERYMLKLKRFQDSEGEIVGFEELNHNDNEATTDALGYTRRSSHQANKRPGGTLGKLLVQDIHNSDWCPRVGTGYDASLRQTIWDNQEAYIGKIIKYRYLPIGTKDQPRHPVFLGFRDPSDL